MTIRILGICSLSLLIISSVCGQDVPPRYAPHNWCETPELAAAVGVTEQCNAFNKTVWDQKVTFTVLYQTFCEYCQQMITTVINPILYPKFKEYVTFELVPYGDGDTGLVEICGIHHIEDDDTRMAFISCMEVFGDAPPLEDHLKICVENASVSHTDTEQITTCYTSNEGKALQKKMVARADSAWPTKSKWVPWIFINNASTLQAQDAWNANNTPDTVVAALTALFCNAYEGPNVGPIVDICQGQSSNAAAYEKDD